MLDMKEEQSVRFFARLNEHDNAKRELMKEKMEVLDKIERLVRNHADEKEFARLFPDVTALNEKLAQEDLKFFNGLSEVLSGEQRGKYLLFERQFERELREAMRDIQRRRMRMGQQ
jgi:molybdopterin converting factor small subunit